MTPRRSSLRCPIVPALPPEGRGLSLACALVVGTGIALTAGPAIAQQSRATQTMPRGMVDIAEIGIRGTDLAGGAPPARQPAPRTRQSRPPTQADVTATIRPSLTPGRLAPDVQPPLTGLPDPEPPPPPLPRRPPEVDPYAPLGLRSGGVTWYPSVEQSIGYDSNPNRSATAPKGSLLSRTEAGLRLESDWPVHALSGALRGSYSHFPDVDGASRPEGSGRLGLRLDATRDTAIDLETRFSLDTERPGSPELNVPVKDRPLIASLGATAGVTQRFNRLELGLRGTVDRTVYEDAELPNGTVLDQSSRDYTQVGARLRAGYELTPGVIPFVEALADTRLHDQKVDPAGFSRDSVAVGGRAGTTFEITRTLTGELGAGWQTRHYEDRRLKDLRGPIMDAALVWSATPLTTVRLRLETLMEETTIPEASGALTQRGTLAVRHDLRRNIALTGSVSLSDTDYRGITLREEALSATAGLEYRLTRSTAVTASFTHERLKSTAPGSDYTANVYLLGMRFQP